MSKGGSPTYINITDEVKAIVKKAASKRVLSASFRRIQPVLYFMKNSYKTECLTGKSPFCRTLKTVWKKIIPEHHSWGTYYYSGVKHFEDVECWDYYLKFLPSGTREELMNADAHLRSAILGNSETLAIE